MASTSNLSTDPQTYPTTAEPGLFGHLLFLYRSPALSGLQFTEENSDETPCKMGRGGDIIPLYPLPLNNQTTQIAK